mmetsp:Transcript_28199/g.52920  ORF Transcript_28199/g.52920 Transcript_28199/m.52920 type:complete len:295 (-) Transcript_28199:458-1342(-)
MKAALAFKYWSQGGTSAARIFSASFAETNVPSFFDCALSLPASCCEYLIMRKDRCRTCLRYLTPCFFRKVSTGGSSSAFRCGGAASLTGRGSCSTGLRFLPRCELALPRPGVESLPLRPPGVPSRPLLAGAVRPDRAATAVPLAGATGAATCSTAAYSTSARFSASFRSLPLSRTDSPGAAFSVAPAAFSLEEDARMKSSGSSSPQEPNRADKNEGALSFDGEASVAAAPSIGAGCTGDAEDCAGAPGLRPGPEARAASWSEPLCLGVICLCRFFIRRSSNACFSKACSSLTWA